MQSLRVIPLLLSLLLCLRVCSGALDVCTANITQPALNANDSTVVLLYNRVTNDSTTCMHYVWATKGHNGTGFPTLFVSQTNHSEACTPDCSEFLNDSSLNVNIPGAVESYFSIGIVFTRLIEFEINAKTAEAVDGFNSTLGCSCDEENEDLDCSYYRSLYLNDTGIQWDYDGDSGVFMATPRDPESDNITSKFRLNITTQFPITDKDSRLAYFPKTLFTANSSTMDILIQDFAYNLTNISNPDTVNASRLALEVYIIHGRNTDNGSIESVQTIDDEVTPSVFRTNTYTIQDSDSLSGYLQWKPISYQTSERRSTASQQVNIFYTADYSICDVHSPPQGLASTLFEGNKWANVTRWFLVFGTPGDDTYFNNNYLTWTSVVGYGSVPTDAISYIVIVTIIVGLGIPAALILVGAVYMFIRKKPWQNVRRLMSKSNQRGTYTKLN